ncbi:ABC transporter permease subunit [Ensifer adhaerens]|uniref:Extradiol ring-cleavage dioxygenase class III enzyme subunit B domain-containing protein n=1 Tax=Ensifer adhaerens TaxID=106592 RepID=A0A9Q8YGJ2_ENSAD|nr:hypothetical protein [Ensifer adhaerens]USJ28498.1 hypothetical protein NE863_35115 [Ensifer adhaerens]
MSDTVMIKPVSRVPLKPICIAIALLVLLLFPVFAGERGQYYTVLLMTVFIFATLGHAWNLLAGFCGLLSFGTQAYVGLSGFTVAILSYYFGVPVFWSLPIAALVAAAFSFLLAAPLSELNATRNTWIGVAVAVVLWAVYEIVIAYNPQADVFGGAYIRRVIILLMIFLGALPLLKLKGAYFAIATWIIASALASVFNEWRVVGAGGGMNIASDSSISARYFAAFVILVLSSATVWWLLNSRYGKALTAVRDDEEAATAVGIDIRRVKTLVFLISAPMSALAAGVYYIDAVTITPPDAFHIRWSAYVVFIVVAGGMGTLWGPIIGALLFVFVQRFLVGIWGGGDLTLGIAAVLLILFLPRGVMGLVDDLRRNGRLPIPKAADFTTVRTFLEAPALGKSAEATPSYPSRPGVVSAFLVPSSPLPYLMPANPAWQALIRGFADARVALEASRPDTILMYSSSWMAVLDQPFQMRERLVGVHIDENWHEYGELSYDLRIDREATRAIIQSSRDIGLNSKPVDFERFPIDSGTISANGFLNPQGTTPLILAGANIYHDYETTERLARKAIEVATRLGRRVAVLGVGGLSGSLFRDEIVMQHDRLKSTADDEWNRSILDLMVRGDASALRNTIPKFSDAARVENRFKHFAWVSGAIGDRWAGARVLGYGPIYGTGAAVIEFHVRD